MPPSWLLPWSFSVRPMIRDSSVRWRKSCNLQRRRVYPVPEWCSDTTTRKPTTVSPIFPSKDLQLLMQSSYRSWRPGRRIYHGHLLARRSHVSCKPSNPMPYKTHLDQYKNRLQTMTSTSPTSANWPSPTSTTSSPTPTTWACSPKKSLSPENRWATRPRRSVTWLALVRRLTWTGWARGRKRVELVLFPLFSWTWRASLFILW